MSHKANVIRVKDIMRTSFGTIEGIATIAEALTTMKTLGTSVLVINKRYEEDEYGLITSGDIARHVLARDRSPSRVNVYEVMQKPVISVRPDMDIRHCSRLFATYDLVRVPVIENKQVIGMVSPNALVLDGLYKIYQ